MGETEKTVHLLTRDVQASVLRHLGEMDNTVLLTRDEVLVPPHLGETDKTVLLLTRDKALVPQHLGE